MLISPFLLGTVIASYYKNMNELKIRDYFACQVINEILKAETDDFKMLHGRNNENVLFANAAKIAYKVADAMLYVRKLNLD